MSQELSNWLVCKWVIIHLRVGYTGGLAHLPTFNTNFLRHPSEESTAFSHIFSTFCHGVTSLSENSVQLPCFGTVTNLEAFMVRPWFLTLVKRKVCGQKMNQGLSSSFVVRCQKPENAITVRAVTAANKEKDEGHDVKEFAVVSVSLSGPGVGASDNWHTERVRVSGPL